MKPLEKPHACARCGMSDVAELGRITLDPLCWRCALGLPPLRPGDAGVGLTHPSGRVYRAAEKAAS